MKGKVVMLNPQKELAAILTENDEYTSVEVLGDYNIDIGDVILGNLESLGSETYYNETKMERFNVFVQDINGNKKAALSIIS